MFYPDYVLKLNSRKELTQKMVKDMFDYNTITGDLLWKVRKAARLKVGVMALHLCMYKSIYKKILRLNIQK